MKTHGYVDNKNCNIKTINMEPKTKVGNNNTKIIVEIYRNSFKISSKSQDSYNKNQGSKSSLKLSDNSLNSIHINK